MRNLVASLIATLCLAAACRPPVGTMTGPEPRALHGALAYRSADGALRVLDDPLAEPRTLEAPDGAFAWSLDGKMLAVARTGGMDIVRADGGGIVRTITVHDPCCGDRPRGIAWTSSQRIAFLAPKDTEFLHGLTVASDGTDLRESFNGNRFSVGNYARDGSLLVITYVDDFVVQPRESWLPLGPPKMWDGSLAPDGVHLLLGSSPQGMERVRDLSGSAPDRILTSLASRVSWSWDSSAFCTVSTLGDSEVRLVRLTDLGGIDLAVGTACAPSPDASLVAITTKSALGAPGKAFLVDTTSGEQYPLEEGSYPFAWAPP